MELRGSDRRGERRRRCREWDKWPPHGETFGRIGTTEFYLSLRIRSGAVPSIQFKGKSVIETYHHTVAHHRLEFDAKLSVLGKGEKPGLDGNLIIEGDNLLALKALLPTHAGKVKCVYIDPPYNTGNEGWIYNDNLTQPQFKEWIGQTVGKEGEDATRHDKWCCMMYPRLEVLKVLMADDGLLFVSIDDIELPRLLMLLEEVFDPNCFIACMVWKARQYPDARALTGVSTDHEYIIVYGKRPGIRLRGGDRDETKYANPDKDSRGDWMSRSILGLATAEQRPNLHYPLVDPKSKRSFEPPPSTGWRYERKTMSAKINEGRILFPKSADGRPREKVFLQELKTKFPGLPSIIDGVHTSDGTKEIRDIFGEPVFQFPKPSELIRMLVEQGTNDDDVILDCTAGSGTTGHAVLAQNQKDEGARRFILIQQRHDSKEQEKNDVNVCEDITRARVVAVANGYVPRGEGSKKRVPGYGGSFTYAKVGEPLFGEYKDLGKRLPSFEDLAKYVFYTETSREIDLKKVDAKTGFIGETEAAGGTSYYMLYTPNHKEDRELSTDTLKALVKKDKAKSLVVYCEKVWMHPEELRRFERENNVRVRAMLVPFNLK
jgi:adenine-specific DNA-methyltransferase